MPKIQITISDELHKLITDYSEVHDCTVSFAASQFAAIGAETLYSKSVKATKNKWGGKRKGSGRKSKKDAD